MDETVYYQLATSEGGTLYGVASAPELVPDGAQILSADVYEQRLAAARAAAAAQLAGDHTQAAQQAVDDYAALIAAGIPEATASRLTGHTP